jgi:hypothetical protein
VEVEQLKPCVVGDQDDDAVLGGCELDGVDAAELE